MATVGSLFPTNSSSNLAAPPSGSTSTSSNSSPVASDPLANESTFLQLLVAQLKNQDPSQPVDGTTFVTQLAQFSDVEQALGTRQDLDAMSEKYLGTTTPPSASTELANTQAAGAESTGSTPNSGTSAVNSPTDS